MGLYTNLIFMARIILTAHVIAAGADAINKAIAKASLADVAADILDIEAEKVAAIAKAEQAEADLNDALALNDKHVATIEGLHEGAPQIVVAKDEETFTVDNTVYGFRFKKLNHKGRGINATNVCADEALQKELIDMGSGMIYKM